MIVWPSKPAAAVEKYALDFTDALNGATITGTPTVTADGVTKDSQGVSGNLVQLVLSGGTEGSVATVSFSLVTNGGETLTELAVLPIGGEAVSLANAKAAQRIEDNTEDTILAGFLRAAIGAVETKTGKNLTPKVETQVVDGFSGCGRAYQSTYGGAIRLWKGPVSSILEVKYDDGDGVEQTLSSYRLVGGANAKLLPAYGDSWPTTHSGAGTVRISYVAGYAPKDLPDDLVHAVILMFGHFYANREAAIAGNYAQAIELPLGVAALIEPYGSSAVA
jgi:uncharacterized phiE125 gp8 family phage protein